MKKNIITTLDKNDLEKIENLFEKKIAFENLIKVIDLDVQENLYDKLMKDYTDVNGSFNRWWQDKIKEYFLDGKQAYVDFEESTLYVWE
jgi:CXXX repeat modification system protein